MNNLSETFLSYGLMFVLVLLLFPTPKSVIVALSFFVYLAWLLSALPTRLLSVVLFLIFLGVPLLALTLPMTIWPDMAPLFRLGVVLVLWGGLISLTAAVVLFLGNRGEVDGRRHKDET